MERVHTQFFSQKKGYNIIGIDNSNEMINVAKEKIEKKKINNITLLHEEAENLNIITTKNSMLCFYYLMLLDT